MAKRFIDTNLFRKKWIRELESEMKLFWVYLLTDCDHAGVWDVDVDRAAFQLNLKITEEKILNTINRKIIPFKRDKWFIPKFIEYQYGELNSNNRAHLSVIKILTKYDLLGANKGLKTPLKEHKYKNKSQKKDQLKEIENNLSELQNEFSEVNVKLEYEKFVDYLAANGKTYKNYNAGFKNWLRNDAFGKAKLDPKKVNKIIDVICTNCDHMFKHKSELLNNMKCPKCKEFGVVDMITYNLMKGSHIG